MAETYPLTVRALTPDGKPVVGATVSAELSSTIVDVSAKLGQLALLPDRSWPMADGKNAQNVIVSPDGKYVYGLGNSTAAKISGYARDAGTGALAPLVGSPWATGGGEAFGATFFGGRLCISNSADSDSGGGGIAIYDVGAGGALSAVAGSPFNGATVYTGLCAVGPILYACDGVGNKVHAYRWTNSALAEISGSPIATGSTPYAVAASTDGRLVFVANQGDKTISGYSADVTGALTALSTRVLRGIPPHLALTGDNCLYCAVGNEGGLPSYVEGFRFDSSGALTALEGSPWTVPHSPQAICVDPSERFVYVPIFDAQCIIMYERQAGGSLDLIGQFPLPGVHPLGAAASPDGRNLYITDYPGSAIYGFDINTTAPLIFAEPVSRLTDAQGEATLRLWPNAHGAAPTQYRISITLGKAVVASYRMSMPARTADITQLVVTK